MTDRVHGRLMSMEDQLIASLGVPPGLAPLDRAVYLATLRATIRTVHSAVGDSLQAALAVVAAADLERAAEALDVPPAMLVRMAEEPHFPDVSLIRRALKAARLLPDLSVDSICHVQDALAINGCAGPDVKRLVDLLLNVAEDTPASAWSTASTHDRVLFHQAVAYAKSITPSL